MKSIISAFLRWHRSRDLWRRVDNEVQRALALQQENFPRSIKLPRDYGKALPERVVELLIASVSTKGRSKVLDVGFANATPSQLRLMDRLPKTLSFTGIDIAPPSQEVKRRYNETILGDVVTAEIPRGTFDLIWCISCIEHLGRDNSAYCQEFRIQRDMDRKALRALWEALKDGGLLLVTAPFGRFEDHGWQVNYDDATWWALLDEAAGKALRTEIFFRHTFGGGVVPGGSGGIEAHGLLRPG